MADQWFYTENGQQQGPVTGQGLRDLASRGILKPSDLVWQEGMSQWTPAGSTRGLLPASQQLQTADWVAAAGPAADPCREWPATSEQTHYARNERSARQRQDSAGSGLVSRLVICGGIFLFLLFASLVGVVAVVVMGAPHSAKGVAANGSRPPVQMPVPNAGGNQAGAAGNCSYAVNLDHVGEENVRVVRFEKNEEVHITVTTSHWAGELEPDVDLFVLDPHNNLIVADTDPDKDCDVRFVAPQAGMYKIIIQLFEGRRVQCTVRY